MTPTTRQPAIDIDAVSAGPELDALVAVEVMGWKRKGKGNYGGPGWEFFKIVDKEKGPIYLQDHVDKYSTDANHVREVEAEIGRRHLGKEYEYFLIGEVFSGRAYGMYLPDGTTHLFPLITATPEQRCRAALRAVMA